MKIWKNTFYCLALIPWTFTISILAFYFHTGFILGHLPSYNNPDPKDLGIYENYINIIDRTFEATSLAFCIFLILTIIFYLIKRKQKNIDWKPIRLCILGYFIVIYILFSGVFEWLVD